MHCCMTIHLHVAACGTGAGGWPTCLYEEAVTLAGQCMYLEGTLEEREHRCRGVWLPRPCTAVLN